MKGLQSLIPDKTSKSNNKTQNKESVFLIDVAQIKPNPHQPRKEFNESELKELADSIKTYGILQPLVATKVEHEVPNGRKVEYELIAGERRLRAAKLAGLPRVPVIVKHTTDKEKLELSLIENVQRNELNPLEEARAYKQLQEGFGMKQKKVAERVAKSPSYVANTVRILSLPKNMQDSLSTGEISSGHTRPLLSLQDSKHQDILFAEIRSQKMNVRSAEARARELSEKTVSPSKSKNKVKIDPVLLELAAELREAHRLEDVKVKSDGKTANLALHFSSPRHMSRWLKKYLS